MLKLQAIQSRMRRMASWFVSAFTTEKSYYSICLEETPKNVRVQRVTRSKLESSTSKLGCSLVYNTNTWDFRLSLRWRRRWSMVLWVFGPWGGIMLLRNVGFYLQAQKALQPKRPTLHNIIWSKKAHNQDLHTELWAHLQVLRQSNLKKESCISRIRYENRRSNHLAHTLTLNTWRS